MRIRDWSSDVCSSDLQAIAKRQAEILRQTVEELQKNVQSLMENGAPEAKVAKGTELTKTAFEKAISNMKELSEMVAKSNGEAFDVINRRVAESLDEIRDLTKKYKRRSEEHTSELQSLMRISYAVFCLKKKKHKIN